MLRINLLPAYVAQRRITRKLVVVFIVLFVAIVGGLGAWDAILYPQIATLQNVADTADAVKTQVTNLQAQAAAATADLGPIQSNLQFVQAIQAYNLKYVQLYQTVARYTSPRILYNSIAVTGTTMTINAYTPSLADLGRYMLIMYKEPDSKSLGISAIPGYGSADPDVATTQSLPTGIDGHLPGYAGVVHSITVYRGRIVDVNGSNSGSGSTPSQGISLGAVTIGGSGQTGGARLFNARTDGFPFTATLTLNQPLTPPSPPGAAPAANAAPGLGPLPINNTLPGDVPPPKS